MKRKIIIGIIGVFLALGLFVGIYAFTVISNTPKIDPTNIYDYLSESSTLYDDKGNVIEDIYIDDGNRKNIKYKEMPEDLVNAIVAIEDKTFWDHSGFNILRMFGAVKDAAFNGGHIGGTSTLTQQLARNVYLSKTKSVRSISRKISEAYYTVLIERELSKKQIAEAYLNTVYLGYNTYGVQSASQAYFGKDPKDLDLAECAALASLPKAPDSYALVKRIANDSSRTLSKDTKVIFETNEYKYIYNGNASKARREQTLKNMLDQELISQKEYDKAIKEDLSKKIKLSTTNLTGGTSYFTDYMLKQVTDDLMEKYKYSKSEAKNLVYTGGLQIHTTLNKKAQKAVEDGFANSANFPGISNIRYDGNGNILGDNGRVRLMSYNNYFDSNKNFTLREDEYKMKDGNLVILKGKRLNFYNTTANGQKDINIEFKEMYQRENGIFYHIKGGIILVPREFKKLDDNGNVIISSKFLKDKQYKDFFKKTDKGYVVSDRYYSLRSKIRQPQGAMVITDYRNGDIKAMIGGRDTNGKMLYNRAINPRQPGSSIKPLTVYSSALQQGADAAASGTPQQFKNYDKNQKTEAYGSYWTAASGVNDAELIFNGRVWPKNWYSGYRGMMSFRKSLEQSVNVNAVRIFQQVGSSYAVNQLKKFGVTTVDEEGSTNDYNAAALALGGMSQGISPLEMAKAYGAFPNRGNVQKSITYTKVQDKKGKTLLEAKRSSTRVVSQGVAFVTQDLLRTTVTNGICRPAQVPGTATAGKTGTTSDQKDIWFCGFTPQYSAALWIGNDMNLELGSSSEVACATWRKIMTQATSGLGGSLPSQPSSVIRYKGEYFVSGTEKGLGEYKTEEEAKKELEKKLEEEKKKLEEELKKKEEEEENEGNIPDIDVPDEGDEDNPDNNNPDTPNDGQEVG